MLMLHSDSNFHYEAIRSISLARYAGADISEQLAILENIKPGDFEDWYREWHNLALRVLSTIDESKLESYSPVTLRDVYFRASHYFFVADFFLHGNQSDPRSDQAFNLWDKYYRKANDCLPIPGVYIDVPTKNGYDLPCIFYRAPQASSSNPRPTLLLGGGFDSNKEELMHVCGFAGLDRGYNVVLYEGPGQPSFLHNGKRIGWRHDWEAVVNPLMDYIEAESKDKLGYIDTKKIGLFGYSLGGYLAARAAAFEPRLAAVILIDGVWSFEETIVKGFPDTTEAFQNNDAKAFGASWEKTNEKSVTNQRWIHDHCNFSFCVSDGAGLFDELRKMNIANGVAEKIKMSALVGSAAHDIFFIGQPEKVAQAIGSNATLVPFDDTQAAGAHCQSGASTYLNQRVMEWFGEVVHDEEKTKRS
ncbi:hypothetical protein PRZ48_009689 [Zasmidium cellare]|uniref:Peptidase S9 prolyl oligopeptidase catalytic domain-containing protein n=1 Tax=Zasmidium cellare TaxID=395010 RepID=A0ABR0ED34_ZASCE|nr:hypothetical protein PRZ48_009689 [Zasmidium cellare]